VPNVCKKNLVKKYAVDIEIGTITLFTRVELKLRINNMQQRPLLEETPTPAA
jgi:hypothetical protein